MNRILAISVILLIGVGSVLAQPTGPFIPDSLTRGLWHLNERSGTLVLDTSAWGNYSIAYGTTMVPGRFGNARAFNGTSDYVYVNPDSSLDLDTASFSVDVWIRTTTEQGVIIRSGVAPVPGFSISMFYGHIATQVGNRTDSFYPDTLAMLVSTATFNDNVWHLITLVRDRVADSLYLYVDGTLATSPIQDPVIFSLSNGQPLTLGAWMSYGPQNFFAGEIDEARLTCSKLLGRPFAMIDVSPLTLKFGKIRMGAADTLSVTISKIPSEVYSVTAVLSRSGYTDISMVMIVSDSARSSSGRFSGVSIGTWHLKIDAADQSGTVLYTGETDVQVLSGQTSFVSLQLQGTTGDIYIEVTWGESCVPPPSGLISWWAGDGSAGDLVGTNAGQILNGVRFVPGKVGQAFSFNGIDDAIRVSNSRSMNISGDLTIDVWVFPTKDVPHASIINKWGDAQTFRQRSFALGVGIGGTVEFPLSDSARQMDATFHKYNTVPGVIAFNKWNHIAAVFDHSTGIRHIYVNGVKVGEREDAPFTLAASVSDVGIGAWLPPLPGVITNGFPGLIDELDVFDRALTADEIRAIFNAGCVGKCK